MHTSLTSINGEFKGKDILSLDQFSPKDIQILFKHVPRMKTIAQNSKPSDLLKGTITTLLFYEPSSRTFGSFAASIKQLGGQTIDIQSPQTTSSVAKGETLEDTIQVFEAYSDAIVIRHPTLGFPQKAAQAAFFVPVINAGDGVGEHPTQALLDLYTMQEKFGRLNNLTILLAGDMLNGRTVHSLIRAFALYPKNTVYLLSPKELRLSREDFNNFSKRGIKLIEIEKESEIPTNVHVWYWTRVQKERFNKIENYEKVKNRFIVTPELLKKYGNKNMVLMHPLPRIGEIEKAVDADPRAIYLRSQVRNGMYVRMALLGLVLGKIS